MAGPLAEAWRAKYPGAYDAVPDAELEAAIVAKYPGAYDHLVEPTTAPDQGPEQPRHPHARVADAAKNAFTDAFAFGKQLITDPIDTTYNVGKSLLQAQYDTYQKAQREATSGNPLKAAAYGVAAKTPVLGPLAATTIERVAGGEAPEVIGETAADVLMGGAGALTLKGAQAGFRAAKAARAPARAAKAAKLGAQVEGDVFMAVPPSKTTPYTPDDFRAAKPYLNEQHKASPIADTRSFRDAADAAIGEIEGRVSGIVDAFPEAKLNPWQTVQQSIADAFKGNPRATAMQAGLKELDDLPLNADLSLPELDRLRLQLNAENKAVLKRNNYDQATARKVDPGFAAREAAARAIRDTLYDYLEKRGVQGVRELRRDEGALIKVRDAANRQAFAGERGVAGTGEAGFVRKAAAELAAKGATAIGAQVGGPAGAVMGAQVGDSLAGAIRGGRKTRNDLIARAFAVADDRLPTYPTVPPRRPVAGLLPPAVVAPRTAPGQSAAPIVEPPITVLPEQPGLPAGKPPIITPEPPDRSGPITDRPIDEILPEHYVRERDALEGLLGPERQAVKAAPDERTFMLRWLADDLREISYQPSARLRGVHAIDEATDRAYGEKATNYAPRVAGTHTQQMFEALGFGGTRAEIAQQIDNYLRGGGRKGAKLEALADAMREAWDGRSFDWDLISDETIQKLGIRRRDLREPSSMPNPDDQPSVYDRFFPSEKPVDAPAPAAAAVSDPDVDFAFGELAEDSPIKQTPADLRAFMAKDAEAKVAAAGERAFQRFEAAAAEADQARQAMRDRSMMYQADQKEAIGRVLGVSAEDLDLPVKQWRAIADAVERGDLNEARELAVEFRVGEAKAARPIEAPDLTDEQIEALRREEAEAAGLRAFHGTNEDFDRFDPSKARTAKQIFAATTKEDAAHYGKLVYELDVKGRIGDFRPEARGASEYKALRRVFDDVAVDYFDDFDDFVTAFDDGQLYQRFASQRVQNQILDELLSSGFDAIRMPDAGFGGSMSESIVVRDPEMIRILKKHKRGE